MTLDFGRLITAMITPFKSDGSVNIEESLRLADHLIATGTETLLLAGTTGEAPVNQVLLLTLKRWLKLQKSQYFYIIFLAEQG